MTPSRTLLPHAGTIPTPDLGLAAGSGIGMMKNEVWKRGRFEQGQRFYMLGGQSLAVFCVLGELQVVESKRWFAL